jgi:deoxyribodipyrimidine photolyase-related protein
LKAKKTFLLESFYRAMRKKHDVLMEAGKPVNGQWNFDSEKKITKIINQPSIVFSNDVLKF